MEKVWTFITQWLDWDNWRLAQKGRRASQQAIAFMLSLNQRPPSQPQHQKSLEVHLLEDRLQKAEFSLQQLYETLELKISHQTDALLATNRALTQRIRTMEQAELPFGEGAEAFCQTVRNAPFPIMIHAEDGRILEMSQAVSEITGYTPAELKTIEDWTERVYGDRQAIVLEKINRLYELNSRVDEGEFEIRTKQGDTRIWLFSSAPLGKLRDGKRLVISMAADVTQQKQVEQELYYLNLTLEERIRDRTQALEAANQELEAFSYSVAHDLRAPLRAIQGFAQVLQEDYATVLDSQGKEYIQRMANAAEHLDILIQDLLAYSQLGRTAMTLHPVNLDNMLQMVLHDLQPTLAATQATLTIAPDLPSVCAHRSVLRQTLLNLINNALKFVAPGVQPHIHIRAEQGEHLPGESPLWIRIWVEDNGIGIAPRHQKRIFAPFERLHGIDTYPGTGIGLSIVQRGVQRMGGQVGVESDEQQGSRFWIELKGCQQHGCE